VASIWSGLPGGGNTQPKKRCAPHLERLATGNAQHCDGGRTVSNGHEVDKEVARQAGRRSYAKLLGSGARIFEYDRTMLHAKVLLVDDRWANVGSGNFDSRSFDLDLEVNVAVHDAGLVAELEKQFLDDVDVSREIDREGWSSRSWRKRAMENATELVRQSL